MQTKNKIECNHTSAIEVLIPIHFQVCSKCRALRFYKVEKHKFMNWILIDYEKLESENTK